MKKIWLKLGLILGGVVWGIFLLCLILSFGVGEVVAGELININTASQAELVSLDGIGEVKAQAIVDYREEEGNFEKIEDIMKVSGIGQATFDKIKNFITVDEGGGGGDGNGDDNGNKQVQKIVINELLPNPEGSDEGEWIELKNIGETAINLAGWKLEDESGKSYVINEDDTGTTVMGKNEFLVIERAASGIVLNNSNDVLKLYDSQDNLVDEVSYAETAKEGWSWARSADGTYNWSDVLTKASENLMGSDGEGGNINKVNISKYSDKVIINELMIDPVGVDFGEKEWIEIYNNAAEVINLSGWKLKDNQKEAVLDNIFMPAGSYTVFSRQETGLILNNQGGEKIELFDQMGYKVGEVKIEGTARTGESYDWCGEEDGYVWVKELTPGKKNNCPIKNDLPIAYFNIGNGDYKMGEYVWLDATESIDRDGEVVEYKWIFNKEVEGLGRKSKEFIFNEPTFEFRLLNNGKYQITLEVKDNLGGVSKASAEFTVGVDKNILEASKTIRINEFLPNPVGADQEGEWIELYNFGEKDLDLSGISLDDDGGSKPFVFGDIVMGAGEYLVVEREESGIVLNNSSDKVRLFGPRGDLIDSVAYKGLKEGESYAFDEKTGWRATEEVTPGEKNEWRGSEINLNNIIMPSSGSFELQDLSEVAQFKVGAEVAVEGVVVVEPGVMSKNTFYIVDKTGGVQIYMYTKEFPALAVGDRIKVWGELSETQGEKRIKITHSDQIIFLRVEDPPKPLAIQAEDIGEEFEGMFVVLQGELVEMKGASWWIDDKTDEAKIYIKRNTGIISKGFSLGDEVRVAGIVSQWKEEYRILPRYMNDVKLIKGVATVNNDYLTVSDGNKNSDGTDSYSGLFKYLVAVAMAIIIMLVTVIIRKNKLESKKRN